MKQKASIEFTEKELEVVDYALTQEMNRSFKNTVTYNINFETLENWYLLLKKIKKAQEQYEQKTIQKKI